MMYGRYWDGPWRDEQLVPSGTLRLVAHPTTEILTVAQARKHLGLVAYGSPPSHPDDEWLTDFAIGAAREACEQEVGLAFVTQTFDYAVRAFPSALGRRPLSGVRAGLRLPMAAPLRSVDSITYRDEQSVTAEVLTAAAPADPFTLAATGTLVAVSALTIVDSAPVPLSLIVGTDYTIDLTTGVGELLTAPGTPPYLAAYTYTADRVLDPASYQVDSAAMPAVVYPAIGDTWPTTLTGSPQAVTVRFTAGFDAPGSSPSVAVLPYRAAAAVRLMLGHLYEHREATVLDQRTIVELPLGVRALLQRLNIDLGMA